MRIRITNALALMLAATALAATAVAAQWPTTCVELNDIVEAHLGNDGNVGIYQRVFGADAEAACQNDHRDDVRAVFAWAIGGGEPAPPTTPAPSGGDQTPVRIGRGADSPETQTYVSRVNQAIPDNGLIVAGIGNQLIPEVVRMDAGRYVSQYAWHGHCISVHLKVAAGSGGHDPHIASECERGGGQTSQVVDIYETATYFIESSNVRSGARWVLTLLPVPG